MTELSPAAAQPLRQIQTVLDAAMLDPALTPEQRLALVSVLLTVATTHSSAGMAALERVRQEMAND